MMLDEGVGDGGEVSPVATATTTAPVRVKAIEERPVPRRRAEARAPAVQGVNRRVLAVVAGAAVGMVGVAVAILATRPSPAPTGTAASPILTTLSPPTGPPPPNPPASRAPDVVETELHGFRAGTILTLDGQPVTVLSVRIRRGAQAHRITLHSPETPERTIEIDGMKDRMINLIRR
jgi:hypothetical protein